MKKLELKDICGYIPYGFKYLYEGNTIGDVRIQDYKTTIDSPLCLNFIIKPLLRPMSDITKEIIHEGERFVPIVELGHIIEPGGNWQVYRDGAGDLTEYGDDDVECVAHLCYSSACFGLSVGDDIESISTSDMIAFLDKLSEWMFDYRGLISAGLAIDVNTLPENPYE